MTTGHLALVRTVLLTAAVLAAAVPVAGSPSPAAPGGAGHVQGSGRIVAQVRQPGPFRGVALALDARVDVVTGGDDTLTIEGDDNIVPLVATAVRDGMLTIEPASKPMQVDGRRLRIVVRARGVEHLGVAGAGTLAARRVRADRLTLEVAGAGTLEVDGIDAQSVGVQLAGSGNVAAAGQAGRAAIAVAGSGKADTTRLDVQHATVRVSGSGQSLLSARGTLAASVAGSGHVGYYGDAHVTRTVAGSGSVQRLGASAR